MHVVHWLPVQLLLYVQMTRKKQQKKAADPMAAAMFNQLQAASEAVKNIEEDYTQQAKPEEQQWVFSLYIP